MTLTERKKEFIYELAQRVAEELVCGADVSDIDEEYMQYALSIYKFDVMEGVIEEFVNSWSWRDVIGDRFSYTLSIPYLTITYDGGFEVEESEDKKELCYEEIADTWFSPAEKKSLFQYDEKKRWVA